MLAVSPTASCRKKTWRYRPISKTPRARPLTSRERRLWPGITAPEPQFRTSAPRPSGQTTGKNVFPAAKGQAGSVLLETPITSGPNAGLIQPCGANSTLISPTTLLTATQAMYDLFCNYSGNETTALELADSPGLINAMGDPVTGGCFPACANINGTLSQGDHYSSLEPSSMDAWRSIGNSLLQRCPIQSAPSRQRFGIRFELHVLQVNRRRLQRRTSQYFRGRRFCQPDPQLLVPEAESRRLYFDTTQIFNANWVYELPIGRGKHFGAGMGGFANAVLGGWTSVRSLALLHGISLHSVQPRVGDKLRP